MGYRDSNGQSFLSQWSQYSAVLRVLFRRRKNYFRQCGTERGTRRLSGDRIHSPTMILNIAVQKEEIRGSDVIMSIHSPKKA